MRLGRLPTEVRINLKVRRGVHGHIGGWAIRWTKGRSRGILDQVVALRGDRSGNVWTGRCLIIDNEAVSHLNMTNDGLVRERGEVSRVIFYSHSSTKGCFIPIERTKCQIHLAPLIEDAAATTYCCIT